MTGALGLTPAQAADRIRVAQDTAVLVRYPSGTFDVLDIPARLVKAMREIAPGWVVSVYPIVGGKPTREAVA